MFETKEGPHDLTCPGCGKGFQALTSELKPGNTIKCSHCGLDFKFTFDAEQIVKDTDKKLQEILKKTFKK